MTTTELTPRQESFINNPQLLNSKIIREYFDPKGLASKEELAFFLALAHERNLNPFLKEIYFVKFNGSPAQTIVAKEVFMKIAESHPAYDGFEAGIVVEDKDGELIERKGAIMKSTDKLVGGWCRVKRKDRTYPSEVQLSLSEFGKGQSTWKTMPANMIRKTAIVNALREAFPGTLKGLYTEEDAGKVGLKDVTPAKSPAADVFNKITNKSSYGDDSVKEKDEEVADATVSETKMVEDAEIVDAETETSNVTVDAETGEILDEEEPF